MKTKKQLAAAAAAAVSAPTTPAASSSDKKSAANPTSTTTPTTTTRTASPSTSTPTPGGGTNSPQVPAAATLKKPLKRLASKAKDSVTKAAGPDAAGTAAKPKAPAKPAPKSEVKSKKVAAPAAGGGKKAPAVPVAPPKKIQKELKNLGITDRAINQIETPATECNPSISEMVKTKSRATVSQLKYSESGAGGPTSATGSKPGEVQKLAEAPVVPTVPTKKRPPPKTKEDPKSQQEVAAASPAREEGGAKNKAPVTALPVTTPSSAAQPAKEDVKAPGPNPGPSTAKSKAKRPESKQDDNDGQQQGGTTAEQKSSPAKKNPAAAVAKPKPKTKKQLLEEKKKAAEEAKAVMVAAAAAAEKVVVAEQATVVVQEVDAVAKQRSLVPLTTAATDPKPDDELKPCSLELDQDDKNDTSSSDVQSRIEDIMKALEESSDGDDDGGVPPPSVPLLLPLASSGSKSGVEAEQQGKVEPVQELVQEKKPAKAAAKPKVAKKKTPAKKKVEEDKTVDNAPDSKNDEKQESPVSKVDDDKSIKKTPASQAKRKYVRKPPSGQAGKQKVDPKASEPVEKDKPKVDPVTATLDIIQESQKAEKADHQKTSEDSTESPDPPKTIRSSTENDDDVPLNRLKDKTPKPTESTSEGSFTAPNAPLLAALLAPSPATPKTPKRKYVRKPSTTSGGSRKKAASKAAPPSDGEAKDKKPEKKDVYDFDDSDSEIDAQPPAGKPFFKTRKPLETSSAKEEDDAEEAIAPEAPSATPDPLESKPDQDPLKESDSDSEGEEFKKPAKKPTKSRTTPKEPSSEEESEEDDKDADPDERPLTPMSKKIKREVRDSSEDSNGDSDSSEESVRTRIVKKQLTAKTRHLKLYGFWSGPKRHRVASLNAIAKVHCLYENETRAALEASLMKQGPPRASRAGTSKEVKKEKIEEAEKKEEVKEEKSAEKKEESETKKPEKVTKAEEQKKKAATKKTEPKEPVKKKETKKVVIKEEKKDEKKKGASATAAAAEKHKQQAASAAESDSESEEESSEEEVVTRTLRCVPGLRGAGKHWDPNASSMESEGDVLPDSDETYAQGKDTDPVKKRKVKRKIVKKAKPKPKKGDAAAEKPKPPVKKIKKEVKAAQSESEKSGEDDEAGGSGSESEKEKTEAASKPKAEEVKKRKREPKEKKEIVESTLGKKRMASLNATAMLAATYEVQRILYRNTDSDSDSPAEKPKAKKVKETKEQKEAAKAEAKKEAKEQKESKEETEGTAEKTVEKEKSKEKEKDKEKEKEKEKQKEKEKEKEKETLVTVKTEPNRERREEHEVKREIEEPRPVSSNLVIAQDTEVTITGVYVNSSLGANQEAYCKMQYRVQQSVTEERLVRPGEAPPKSYTPLTALSSMRPPNDQALATPPLFGPPSQCDSPLGLGPRSFYPPPTSSSGSSSAFCAPIPHGSPGYYQPAGPLISPHLLAQPIPVSQHGGGSSSSSSTITKQPPESDSPGVSSLVQPPSSSTADSTDSDVLLTAGDLSSRSQQSAAYRYGPAGPHNLYPRPVQMHCPPPPPHLAPNYYAAPPYSQYPPEMYYTHAYPPAHFYPKFAQYYPSRRYYPAPPGMSGPPEHLYEQPPPPPSAGGPVPPPAGAQLVPAGPPQGPPQHLEHYPGPPPYPYPGYGSPGPGPGGQCYSRPPYMDAHYTTNCPCPMQSCPKNVNAGSLIGIKASKGPVTTTTATPQTPNHQHIASSASSVQMSPSSSCTTSTTSYTEPIVISSGSSTSSSPPPQSPIAAPPPDAPVVSTMVTTSTAAIADATAKVKPESDLYSYHPHHYPHRPSAPPPTHPLHSYIPVAPVEVKQEPQQTVPTVEPGADTKTTKNIPKLLPLVKQEITEVKQEPQPVTVLSCKKEDFEENGPAMTPDLLLDEALIKKEALVTELLLPEHHHRCYADNQKLDDKSILSDILTAEANLITSKTIDNISVSSNNQNNNNNSSSISNEKVQLVDSILPEIPASTVKRRPLLVACKKSTPKKSPPNSYKNLIKRTNLGGGEGEETSGEPTITVLSDDDDELEEDDEDEVLVTTPKPKRKLTTKPRKLLKRTRRVFGAEQLRHLQKLNRSVLKSKRIRRIVKRPSCVPRNPTVPEVPTAPEPEPTPVEPVEVQEPAEQPPRPMSNVDLTIDLVAKGYFSEPEIVSTEEAKSKSRALKRLKQQEGRSQSEQNRGRHSSKKAKQQLDDPLDIDFDRRWSCKGMAPQEQQPEDPKRSTKAKSQPKKPKKRAAPKTPKHNGKKRATSTPLPAEPLDQPELETNPLDVSAIDEPTAAAAAALDDRETDFDDAATMLVDDDMMSVDTNTMISRHNNNNNNSAVENKNAIGSDPLETEEDPLPVEPPTCVEAPEDRLPAEEEDDDEEEEIMLARRFAKKSGGSCKRTSRSRSKSKSRKFSIKKRHRPRVAEVEEVIVPRKSNSVPRWSNGWTWEGQPFQGKVFLNSDDPPVTRTCYPAMRHSEGDIIRPRDSVLLRAGSKRAELPYVAKVAHLWENPEDGEMMMSLLWYYRPEHTEQGRQPADGPDEVFASRHKDHNSVACIEDKCYVLTFSEYCRFRRQLRGFEENIEEQPSIVPPLRRENPRLPPSIVSPELVMYCQRVYEFRLKRLLKQPS